jgi:hypothetical protein
MVKKLFTYLILPAVIAGLAYLCVDSIMQPVNFNKRKDAREQIAIQRLKDIRDLQVAFKSVHGRFSPTVDSLVWFYNEGKINVVMQVGSMDDSLAVVNTEKIKKQNPRLKGDKLTEKLAEAYAKGISVVYKIEHPQPVKESIFTDREDFCVDSLKYIPFCGEPVIMESTIKTVSGVKVPLFEACMPYKKLLRGLDNQLRINLDAEREDTGRYPGLMVGSITAPNNNAGNWE